MSKKKSDQREPPLLLLVTWTDAGVVTQGDWMDTAQVREHSTPERFINRTVGWLIHEDRTALVLASQIADGSDPSYDLVMRIPRSLVKSRRVLR